MSYKDITLNVSKTIKVSPFTWDGKPKEMKGKDGKLVWDGLQYFNFMPCFLFMLAC